MSQFQHFAIAMKVKSFLPIAVSLYFVALTAITIAIFANDHNWHRFDLKHYHDIALQVCAGRVPYRDFLVEYPPLSLLPIVLPQLLAFGRPLDYDTYVLGFVGLFFLGNVGMVTLIRRSPHFSPRNFVAFLVLSLAISPFLLWRYDLFPTLLTLLSFLALLSQRAALSGVWLGFGIAAKLYPIVLLPLFAIYCRLNSSFLNSSILDYGDPKDRTLQTWRDVSLFLGGAIAAVAIVFLPFIVVAPGELLSFLFYHQQRGLQIESLPAGILLLGQLLGMTQVQIVQNFGAHHLISANANAILPWLPYAFLLGFGSILVLAWQRFQQERDRNGRITTTTLAAYSAIALLVFTVTNKVFSPQYIIWFLPFLPLVPTPQVGLAAIAELVTIAFSIFTRRLRLVYPPSVVLLNCRNFAIVMLLAWLIWEFRPMRKKFVD